MFSNDYEHNTISVVKSIVILDIIKEIEKYTDSIKNVNIFIDKRKLCNCIRSTLEKASDF